MQRKNNCFGSRKMCRYFFLFLLLRTFFISNTCDGRSSWALDYLKMREALKIKELLQEGKYERSKFMTFQVNKIVRGYKNKIVSYFTTLVLKQIATNFYFC